jgi:hypothetical protein
MNMNTHPFIGLLIIFLLSPGVVDRRDDVFYFASVDIVILLVGLDGVVVDDFRGHRRRGEEKDG